MLSPDPIKRNINPYPYCDNDPVNYSDPTGEIANILVGAGLGGFFGGAAGFLGNAASQLMDGGKKCGVDFEQMDYIIGGYVKKGTKFITRPVPGLGSNSGGAIEIVTPPNSVELQYFHMLGE